MFSLWLSFIYYVFISITSLLSILSSLFIRLVFSEKVCLGYSIVCVLLFYGVLLSLNTLVYKLLKCLSLSAITAKEYSSPVPLVSSEKFYSKSFYTLSTLSTRFLYWSEPNKDPTFSKDSRKKSWAVSASTDWEQSIRANSKSS